MADRVTCVFSGLMLEKFLERALREGVRFGSVRRAGRDEARLVTDARGAKKLMDLAKAYDLNVREEGRRGAGALLARALGRWTLIAAFLLCAALSLALLERVWIVRVEMLDGGDGARLEEALGEVGIVPGARRKEIDMGAARDKLMSLCPEYAYIGLRARGVVLRAEGSRAIPAPGTYRAEAARDLVARCDAVVLSVDVLAGTPQVSPGAVVRRGDVLIRGEERDERETVRGVRALGTVMGRTWLTGEARASLTQNVLVDTGETRREKRVACPLLTIPLEACEPFATERIVTKRQVIGGLLMPLAVEEVIHMEQRVVPRRADEAKIKEEISQIALAKAFSLRPEGVLPVDKWVDYSMINRGVVCARAVLEIEADIAADRDALNP